MWAYNDANKVQYVCIKYSKIQCLNKLIFFSLDVIYQTGQYSSDDIKIQTRFEMFTRNISSCYLRRCVTERLYSRSDVKEARGDWGADSD